MKRSSFLLIVLAALTFAAGARAQTPPAIPAANLPTPYSSPLFHAGGVSTPYAFPALPAINPLFGQLQGTPSDLTVFNGAMVATEVPSFLLGNYDPTLPPAGFSGLPTAGVGIYFPNNFRDDTQITSWSAPLTFLSVPPTVSPTALATYNAGNPSAVPPIPAPIPPLNHDVQGTPTAVNWTEYPDITNASYYGIDPASASTTTAPPDSVIHGGGIVPAVGDTPLQQSHAIRQLVYFGRSEYIVDARTTSPTFKALIHVGAIYCVDGFTGEVVWRYQTATAASRDASVFSTPAVVKINVLTNPGSAGPPVVAPTIANKLVVIVGDNNGFVYCLDAVGSGTSPGSKVGSSNLDAVDTTNNQPIIDASPPASPLPVPPKYLGTTTAYWVYRPDAAQPLTPAGLPVAALDATADMPVPGAFGLAAPNVYVENRISTTAPTQSNSIIYLGNTNGVLYALDGLGVPNTAPNVLYNASLPVTATGTTLLTTNNTIRNATPTTNPLWWFWPGGAANPDVSMESTPVIAPPSLPATLPTTTIVTSSANPIAAGASVTYVARVSDATGGGAVPTGTVTITVGGTSSGALPLIGGLASFTSAGLVTPGANSVTATYTPTVAFAGSSTALNEVVESGLSTDRFTIVTSSENPSFANSNPAIPGDTVTFTGTTYDGTGAIVTNTPTLTIDGTVAGTSPVTTNLLTVGTHSISSSPAPNITSPFFQVVNGVSGPTICIGTSHELGAGTNAGRLYAVDAFSGPSGNGGTGPAVGTKNYNLDQRPNWAFPNAYLPAAGSQTGKGNVTGIATIRPALGNISGSPVVFTNPDDVPIPGGPPRTRIYFAADSGLEVPYIPPPAPSPLPLHDPAPRPADNETGRLWAVDISGANMGRVATTTNLSPAVTNIWAYPLANDPNDATKDRLPEPSPPMGAFLHATPAMGVVQFPATILNGTGTTYTHTDSVNTTDIKGKAVPMLYIGTEGVDDFGFYALDVDGYDDATRDIYRVESPTGASFASSPALIVNSSISTTPPPGNGGAVFATAGDSLFQFSATPLTNLNSGQAFPFVSVDKTFTGFGPVSAPTVAAADVTDIVPTTYLNGKNATDWVYVGDSATGFCRGITPLNANDLAIVPPVDFGGVPDANPPQVISAQYPLRVFLFDNSTTHPANTTSMKDPNPNPLNGTIAVFEWGSYAYIRIANVVPPGFDPSGTVTPNMPVPAGFDATKLVQDPVDPTIFYGNGKAVTFKVGEVSDPNAFAPTITIQPTLPTLTSLTGAATDNGFIQRPASDLRPDEPVSQELTDSATAAGATGKGWLAAYSYPIGSYRTRSGDTPGARRRITEAQQTAIAYKLSGGTYTVTGNVTLEAQTLQGTQSGTAATGLKQTPSVEQPTFGILNPLALRGGGLPYALNGTAAPAAPLGELDGVGPFRGIDPALPPNSEDLQALTNGNSVYDNKPPRSGVDTTTQDPTTATTNRILDTTNYHKRYKFIATSLGLIHDGSTGDNSNSDPTQSALPQGVYPAPASPIDNGLGGNRGAGGNNGQFGPAMLNIADRSLLGRHLKDPDPLNTAQPLFPAYPIAMLRNGAHWNDNTGYNGPGACVNRLPWEDLPSSVGLNVSRDYPDIPASAITHTLTTSAGNSQEITGRHSEDPNDPVPDPALPGTDDQHRLIRLNSIKIAMQVPKYQPANLQAWDASQYVAGADPASTSDTQAAITPSKIRAGDNTFPEGYVEGGGQGQRVFIDLNHNGVWDNNEPEHDVQVFSGVGVNMSTSMVASTVDVGPVPSGFGIQTNSYGPLGPFTPYPPTTPGALGYQNNFLPVTAHNDSNVNLLNVHFDQKINTGSKTIILQSDPLDPSSFIPAFDSVGIAGPFQTPTGTYLLRSSLDTDLLAAGQNPGVLSGTDAVTGLTTKNLYPSFTFHKARTGGVAPTLTVPDSPDSASSPYYVYPSTVHVPTTPVAVPAPNFSTLPFISVAVPFGTPVGPYAQTVRLFEGIDIGGYSTYSGNPSYNPLYPPQYGGAIGGLGTPSSLSDVYQVGNQPLSDPGVTVRTSVLEDRMTDGLTFGGLPQIDNGFAGTGLGGTSIATPDFAPAAFQAFGPTGGNLSVYWTSGLNRTSAGSNEYGIYGALATYTAPAYLPSVSAGGIPSWFAPNNPTTLFSPGTNSGLTIAQDVPLLSGSSFAADNSTAYAFAVNVNTPPYQNALYCYPVTQSTGALGAAQRITSDPAQVKYGVRGLYCSNAGFTNNLWAFWTASTHGRTAIYYNSTSAVTGKWPLNTTLLPVPAGLTAVADACPALSSGIAGSTTLPQAIDVTFSGTAADGNADLYVCRYTPHGTAGPDAGLLDLQTFPTVTEQLQPINGWYQARDVAWSRAVGLNVFVGQSPAVPVLYTTGASPTALFKSATFDRASGLLVFSGVSLTPATPGTFTNTLYVDLSTGRVRFVTAPTAKVTATFGPQARRITDDARADTGVVTFLDPTFKTNEGNTPATTLPRVQTDRRWYFWRKAGTADSTTSATLYQKSQRLTVYLPAPVDVSQSIVVTNTINNSVVSGFTPDVLNIPAVLNTDGSPKYPAYARLYFPIIAGSTRLEGLPVTVSYTPLTPGATGTSTYSDTIQWQDEARANLSNSAPPTDAASGLASVTDTPVQMDKRVNENNVAAFLDVNAYTDLAGGSAATDAAHKIWLFWNSTRNGTADLYYETVNPRFTATGP